ncbi:MAG TPA: Trm112 family protein [candidate division Zixibacteria bacterium]|nr:Trm112 family protein [candidate division Zixibacteria bacterium]MDD4916772.1 Trm112 family protein [candidate division Zixibacteria bacterium]MDM7973909.1 Trm112 family protein [candidate division Zixibacteria bacterium]HOD66111.1 Trm112 family protein [candidate division Zixibacteria bacterium]HOZ06839.1 Trm112 family protein [candidate division Zixibacteria bacterium]
MPLSDKLLSKLACPKCRGPLSFDADQNRLLCSACRLSYPVREDIPVLLVDEAEKL